ncbi:aminomethyl-transferring glycine dehydrogenase subunit GcvPB [Candidatus Protochlamydia sp. W-9]|uniref:aminomethyl-transferring glycine dehydrogenase subunit GcvPB n=1 Tax=Candidatus Protochlamydia sp. W-9 TaxID=1785087 RepID=UPI00096A2620|nr:aminomethyl-transferring glycine dehydrogenase subunit GcvPB [Candidatus Protochlamydia sp. W-9]
MTKTIFEKSQFKQKAYSLPYSWENLKEFSLPKKFLRQTSLPLPEVSEIDLTRHFAVLAKRNMGIDTNFYPLGSCTMKLNPRINEWCANLPNFTRVHPLAPDHTVQGNLQIIDELIQMLCKVSGMTAGSLVPNAGAQGEFAGIQMIAAYHRHHRDFERDELLIPDNAHGTNPATAAMAGFKTISLRTNAQGDVDIDHLKSLVSDKTAGLMLTNPNTLGLFSSVIKEIAEIVHKVGGFLYYDGANLNSILNVARPGDMGFDVMHINLHKTFSTPHGGGGPGSGPVLCGDLLKPFLPNPRVEKENDHYVVKWKDSMSIGQIASFQGNFAIYLRAYLYAKLHGYYGLRKIAEVAVLNANYLKKRISKLFNIPFEQFCMHEFVVQADNYLGKGVRALDIAKRLLDYGVHAPTVYFPLIIKECMLIEPTESESKNTLDQFVSILERIVAEIHQDPQTIKNAPHQQPVSRLDEVLAAKRPILKHQAD